MTSHSPKPIKVMIAIEAMDVGGAEMDILRNFPCINESDQFEVLLCCFRRPGTLFHQIQKENIQAIASPALFNNRFKFLQKFLKPFHSLLFLLKTLRREQPDIVHCFLPRSYLMTCVCKLLLSFSKTQSKYVMSRLSLNDYMKNHKILALFEKYICHRVAHFDAFIGNSKVITQQLASEGCRKDNIHLLYNGIQVQSFVVERDIDFKELSTIQFVAVGNLHTYKGYDDLIEAFYQFEQNQQSTKSWSLKIAGQDKHGNLDRLNTKIKNFGLDKKITLLGKVDDIPSLLASSHVFIHPSHTEGLPNAIIEAMASGLPVLASNVGGVPELVEQNQTGFLFEPKSPESIAKTLTKTFTQVDMLAKMGKKAQSKALSNFDLKSSVANYKATYLNVIKN